MFTVLLGKPNRLFHRNRSQDSTLISVLLNTVLTVSHWYSFLFIFRDIQSDYHQHLTRWLIYVSCALNFVALKCWGNCRTYINSLLNWTPAFAHFEPTRWNLQWYFLICVFLSHFKPKKIESVYFHQQSFGTLFILWWVSAILQALYTSAVVHVKWKMKFDSSSWYVKADLLRFCGDRARVFFFCKLHIYTFCTQSSKYLR